VHQYTSKLKFENIEGQKEREKVCVCLCMDVSM